MNLLEWFFVVFIAFLSGMGNKIAGEAIDYLKKKRHVLKQMVLNNGKVKEK